MNVSIVSLKSQLNSGQLPGVEAHKRVFNTITRPTAEAAPPDAKQSAVLLLLFEENSEWRLLLIERTKGSGVHSGQMGFPGGRLEQYDDDLLATAIRETFEEVGIVVSREEVLGRLTPIYIPVSNYIVQPYLALIERPQKLKLEPKEVTRVVYMPLSILKEGTSKVNVPAIYLQNKEVNAYCYQGYTIWGASAMMLSELDWMLSIQG